MSRVLRVSDGNYKIIVGDGNDIVLDTGDTTGSGNGRVIVTGDLVVQGDTTTMNTQIVTIEDNILQLSSNNPGPGLSSTLDIPYSSGIEVNLGDNDRARWLYNDSISWRLGSSTSGVGTWQAVNENNVRMPLATPGVFAGSSDFYIETNGVISVESNLDYEKRVYRYSGSTLEADPITNEVILNDDAIPNAKAVDDLINYKLANPEVSFIVEDDTSVNAIDKNNIIFNILTAGTSTVLQFENPHGWRVNDTIVIEGVQTLPNDVALNTLNGTFQVIDVLTNRTIQINANTLGGNTANYVQNSGSTVSADSKVSIRVEGREVSAFYKNSVQIQHIDFFDTTITTTSSNSDLVLKSPGTGTVKIDDTIEITRTPGDDDFAIDPSVPDNGIKLYSKLPGPGDTGLYFRNETMLDQNGTADIDELVSKNRALLYSMLF